MTSLADAKFRRQVWPSLDVQEYHLILLGCLKAEPRDSRQRTELTVSKGEKSSLEFCGMLFMIVAGLLLREPLTSAFVHTTLTPIRTSTWLSGIDRKEWRTSSYKESGSFSKNLVSSLTNFVNSLSGDGDNKERVASLSPIALPPSSPQELLDRIRKDYVENNYLWTGDIDLASFHSQCEFTDPTLSFTGRDQFVANIQNLKSIVDVLVKGDCRSDLLDIQLNQVDGYIQTRWNMVGQLAVLPWKPKIDVIGRTKFWFNETGKAEFQVVVYDEEWEIPAGLALLQLVTPPGTIPNSKISR